jgi:hypothetical protein
MVRVGVTLLSTGVIAAAAVAGSVTPAAGNPTTASAAGCIKPSGVATLVFSRSKYPNIRKHAISAIRRGWPAVLVLNRRGADDRRDRLLGSYRTKRNYDRDEYPPAVGRGVGNGLTRGSGPTGWRASVWYVPSSENRSHGASMGGKLRKYCNGTRFRYAFR